MQACYYDPVVGRFMSPDPLGYADQLNLYAYVGGDPVNRADPSGLCGLCMFGRAGGFFRPSPIAEGVRLAIKESRGPPPSNMVEEKLPGQRVAMPKPGETTKQTLERLQRWR